MGGVTNRANNYNLATLFQFSNLEYVLPLFAPFLIRYLKQASTLRIGKIKLVGWAVISSGSGDVAFHDVCHGVPQTYMTMTETFG